MNQRYPNQRSSKHCRSTWDKPGRIKAVGHRFVYDATHCKPDDGGVDNRLTSSPRRRKRSFMSKLESSITAQQAKLINKSKPQSTCFARVLWVRRTGNEMAKSMSLINRFADAGIQIWVIEAHDLVDLVICQVTDFDLILFEYLDHVESEMKTVVSQLRLGSRAPLLMLTDNLTSDWSVGALHAGADAICALSTPDEVILARCTALLRRWLASA